MVAVAVSVVAGTAVGTAAGFGFSPHALKTSAIVSAPTTVECVSEVAVIGSSLAG